jgi:hypothetical protein
MHVFIYDCKNQYKRSKKLKGNSYWLEFWWRIYSI